MRAAIFGKWKPMIKIETLYRSVVIIRQNVDFSHFPRQLKGT